MYHMLAGCFIVTLSKIWKHVGSMFYYNIFDMFQYKHTFL